MSTRGFVRLYVGYGVKELSRMLGCAMVSSLVNSWACSFVCGLWSKGVKPYVWLYNGKFSCQLVGLFVCIWVMELRS